MKLHAKLLLALLPAIAASLLLLGFLAYQQLRQSSEERFLNELRFSAMQADERLQGMRDKGLTDSALLANFKLLQQYVLTGDEDERLLLLYPALVRTLRGIQEILPSYYEIRLLMPDGYEELRVSTRSTPNRSEEEAGSELFQRIAGMRKPSAQLLSNPDNGEPVLYVARPLWLRDPNLEPLTKPPSLRAYLVITVDLSSLEKSLAENRPGKNGSLMAFLPGGDKIFPRQDPEALKEVRKGWIATGEPFLETPRWLYFQLGDNQLLDFVSALPRAEISRASLELARNVTCIIGASLLLLSLIVYLLLRHSVQRPIHRLIAMAGEVSRGNLDIVNDNASGDEVGALGDALETMAQHLKQSEQQIKMLAFRDSLTGLPNRTMFKDYLSRVVERSKRNEECFALMFIDIDDFKKVNDSQGHQTGDKLLQEIARRIQGHVRSGDIVAEDPSGSRLLANSGNLVSRLGGDEFTVLLPVLPDPMVAATVAQRLIDTICEPCDFGGEQIRVGASVGIALFPDDAIDEHTLIHHADLAMYHAKEIGKNNFQFYREGMNERIHEKLQIENRLRRALEEGGLRLVYQPQVDPRTERIVGFEALLRWQDEELGNVRPDIFIPIAEASGEILALGEWVIEEACRQQQAWRAMGLPAHIVSVNISSRQFERSDVAALLASAIERYGLTPNCIKAEITESTTMMYPKKAAETLQRMKETGIKVSLDDFGTGYSSLSHLMGFPIDELKIDRSFVQALEENEDSVTLVSTIIAMAKALKLTVVAEGAEVERQVDILRQLDCDVIQGFYYIRPVEADQVADLLQRFEGGETGCRIAL
ncbi:MAG TPA: EAL domain-containing protein [Gammaproteobacteria bacterium]|nr:EAL domain-containing protein [Gammaproteobacteria bacterium]